jgi:hypothetical protein
MQRGTVGTAQVRLCPSLRLTPGALKFVSPLTPFRQRTGVEQDLDYIARASPAYHLIIYRFRPIFAAGARTACNGR